VRALRSCLRADADPQRLEVCSSDWGMIPVNPHSTEPFPS